MSYHNEIFFFKFATFLQTPQMILLTFDGALNGINYKKYNQIFLDNRTNPNDCPIRGTFFMTHDYSEYPIVQDMYSKGHEMAVASSH